MADKTLKITLDENARHALATALENYLNGCGMEDGDDDEDVLEAILYLAEHGTAG